jgi:hypothetical protein
MNLKCKEQQQQLSRYFIINAVFIYFLDLRDPIGERKIPELLNWLKDNEAHMEGISVSQFEGFELGMRADIDFADGEMLLAVPRKLMLSIETACGSELGKIYCTFF